MSQQQRKIRTFEDEPAVRGRVPLWIGLFGWSGCGKTMSALRLATGIQRVVGGEVFGVDSELERMKHYAPPPGLKPIPGKTFAFRHVALKAPFNPYSYLDAYEHCVKQGAKVIVVDSKSHEHNGIGGYLEMAEATGIKSAGKWSAPAAERLQVKNRAMQLPVHFIFCFRGKNKIKVIRGEEPEQLGTMPESGNDWIYEMTAQCLLRPRSGGVPDWYANGQGEDQAMKLTEPFKHLLTTGESLSEDMGEAMARWAQGGPMGIYETLATEIGQASADALSGLGERAKAAMEEKDRAKRINRLEARALSNAIADRRKELGVVAPKADAKGEQSEGDAPGAAA